MSFADAPECVARELETQLAARPGVVATDRIGSEFTPSGRVEIEVIVEATARGTVPNCVTWPVVQSSLGIADVTAWNAPDTLRVVIR